MSTGNRCRELTINDIWAPQRLKPLSSAAFPQAFFAAKAGCKLEVTIRPSWSVPAKPLHLLTVSALSDIINLSFLARNILLLCPVGHHDINEEPRDLIGLEEAHLHQDIPRDGVSRLAGGTAMGYSQEITSAAKAVGILAAFLQA